MRFACEHCGRSYAVADELRGKTFKMRCKACGHLIVVKGGHAAEPGGARRVAPSRAEATPTPVTVPGAPPGDEPLERSRRVAEALPVPEENPFVARPISAAGLEHLATGPSPGQAEASPSPPAERSVDLVDDDGGPAVDAVEPEFPEPPPPLRGGAGFPDPFADWEALGEVEKGPPAEGGEPHPVSPLPEPVTPRTASAEARRAARTEVPPPLPTAAEGLNPKVLAIAGAVAVAVVAVLLFVYVGRGGKAPGPAAPVAARPAPAAAQPPAVAGASEPIPALAAPESAREEEPARRAEPAQRKPRPAKVAREERRAEPASEPPPRAEPAPAPAAATAAPDASEAQPKAAPPTPEQIARIVSANRRAFERCVAEAAKRDPGLEVSGRQVTLMLTVNPSGQVASPTVDDVELATTDLGACITSAARLMMFPAFEGEPVKVEVPLRLGR